MKIPNKSEFQEIVSIHSPDIGFKDFMRLCKDYTEEPYSFLVNDGRDLLEKAATFKRFKFLPSS